jgi:hypothetical protein
MTTEERAPRHAVCGWLTFPTPSTFALGSWRGSRKFEGQSGHNFWSFSEGRNGHTTLWLDQNGLLHGQVREAPVDWDFVATREQ